MDIWNQWNCINETQIWNENIKSISRLLNWKNGLIKSFKINDTA